MYPPATIFMLQHKQYHISTYVYINACDQSLINKLNSENLKY